MNDDKLTTLMKESFAGVHMTMPPDQVVRRGRAVRTRRRRLRGLTGAVTLAGSAVAAVALLVPGGHPVTAQLAAWTVTRNPDGGIKVTVNQMKDPGGLQATLRADGIPARVTFDPVNAMTQPLPAGCTAPGMSAPANARLQTKVLTPPAIWAYRQQQRQRIESLPIQFTYTMNGHVEHATVPRGGGADWYKKLRQLTKEGAEHMTITGLGIPFDMPSSLQTLQERETKDAAGRPALYINPAAIPAGIGLSIGVDVASPSNFNFGVDLVVTSPQCTGS
jgi:hypothetical protein